MAQINYKNIVKVEKSYNSVHKAVDSTYTVFVLKGKKYFQLDTYGSTDRKYVGKVSQSIQFDKDTANNLIELLKHEFEL